MIVDDEQRMAEELKIMVREADSAIEITDVCYDGETALALAMEKKPDIIFLDIEMPGLDGLKVAECLSKTNNAPMIVFVTAYDEFALKAFSVNAVDYIVKPLDEESIKRVLEKCRNILQHWEFDGEDARNSKEICKKFSVEKGDRMEIIDSDTIRYIYAKDRQVFIVTKDDVQYLTRMTLHDFELRLPVKKFFRCHRNFIVNIDEIRQIVTWFKQRYLLVLNGKNKIEIPVGRVYVNKMKQYIEL